MKVEEELTLMKKNKIKVLSIIFLGLAVLTMISWTITFVLEIDLFSIVTNSAFLTILFIPFVIVIYVAGAVGVIGVSTYLGIAIMVLNIIKLTINVKEKVSIKFNIFNICAGLVIIATTGVLYALMGV